MSSDVLQGRSAGPWDVLPASGDSDRAGIAGDQLPRCLRLICHVQTFVDSGHDSCSGTDTPPTTYVRPVRQKFWSKPIYNKEGEILHGDGTMWLWSILPTLQ